MYFSSENSHTFKAIPCVTPSTSIRLFPKPTLRLASCPPGQHLLSQSQQSETQTSHKVEAVPQEPGRVLGVLSTALSQENLPKDCLTQKPTSTAEQTSPMVCPPLVHMAQLLTCSSRSVKSFTVSIR